MGWTKLPFEKAGITSYIDVLVTEGFMSIDLVIMRVR